jgi:lipid A 4'-phosphatase
MTHISRPYLYVLLPILGMLLIAPFTPALDLSISHYFFDPTGQFRSGPFYDFMFDYAVIPAQAVAIIAFFIYCFSFFVSSLKKLRSPSLVLVVTMLLGAGFIVHTLLKDHWGRPRPKQVIEFNGGQPFHPFYQPNFFDQPEPSKSFPCGHCTMGFYFFALALVLKRAGYRISFYFTLALACLLGIAFGYARIAQGGHFFSDVLMTALIMWITAYLCDIYLSDEEY